LVTYHERARTSASRPKTFKEFEIDAEEVSIGSSPSRAPQRGDQKMAKRALAFGARFKGNGRTVKVRKDDRSAKSYEVEVTKQGRRSQRRQHDDLGGALKDFASSWRSRLN
jgi:hypothetical protein